MNEFEESQDKARASGSSSEQQRSGAVLATLLRELRTLRQRNKELEAAIELANRKVAFYEQYDAKLQGALTTALKVAFEIKADAEEAAKAIIEGALKEREAIQKEMERLKVVTQAMHARAEVSEEVIYPSGEVAVTPARAEPVEVAARAEIEAPQPVLEAVARVEPPILSGEPAVETEPVVETERPVEVLESASEVSEESPAPVAKSTEESLAAAVGAEATGAQAPVDVGENHNRVELVVSSLPSFLRLVDFERSLTRIAAVKNFYVRDFRRGVARIELKLLSANEWPRLIEGLNSISGLKIATVEAETRRIEGRLDLA